MHIEHFTKNSIVNAEVTPLEGEEAFQTVTASLTETLSETSDESIVEMFEDLKTAAQDPILDGRPRMLHITAVIVHEGVNSNGDGFYAEDLQKAVSERKLFKDGYGGMIDINHDFTPVGYWYDAEYILDPATQTAGILAKGAIWAWRFPEVADKILADQHRNGTVPVSMTCICKSEDISYARDDEGRYVSWNRNPVFVATTMLFDTPAGDINARGVAEEDPVQITDRERQDSLLKAAAKTEDIHKTEDNMPEEIKALLDEKLEGLNAEALDQIKASISSLEDKLSARNDELDGLKTANADLTEQITDLQTTIDEQKLAIENLTSAKEDLEATVAEQKEAIDAFEAKEAEAALEAKKEARLADVSDSVRERMAAMDETKREAIVTRWAKQSDEEWEITKAEHALAVKKASDKPLPNAGGGREKSLTEYLN